MLNGRCSTFRVLPQGKLNIAGENTTIAQSFPFTCKNVIFVGNLLKFRQSYDD